MLPFRSHFGCQLHRQHRRTFTQDTGRGDFSEMSANASKLRSDKRLHEMKPAIQPREQSVLDLVMRFAFFERLIHVKVFCSNIGLEFPFPGFGGPQCLREREEKRHVALDAFLLQGCT
jgi:hypothetical protein